MMATKHKSVLSMRIVNYSFYFLTLFASCSNAQQRDQATHQSLDAQTFQRKLQTTADAVVLDVRTPDEVKQGKIPGATNIDFYSDDFKTKVSALDKNKTYFVYCARGGRSSEAVDIMSSLGFTKLVNLDGGFTRWKESRMPVVQGN